MKNDISSIQKNKQKYFFESEESFMDKTHSWKQFLVINSLIFGLFLGSGNLIFPVHLGQLSGHNLLNAGVGFVVSGALFPLLAILAVTVTNSDGLYHLAKPTGIWYAGLFLILVHLTIGPFSVLHVPQPLLLKWQQNLLFQKNLRQLICLFSLLFSSYSYFFNYSP